VLVLKWKGTMHTSAKCTEETVDRKTARGQRAIRATRARPAVALLEQPLWPARITKGSDAMMHVIRRHFDILFFWHYWLGSEYKKSMLHQERRKGEGGAYIHTHTYVGSPIPTQTPNHHKKKKKQTLIWPTYLVVTQVSGISHCVFRTCVQRFQKPWGSCDWTNSSSVGEICSLVCW